MKTVAHREWRKPGMWSSRIIIWISDLPLTQYDPHQTSYSFWIIASSAEKRVKNNTVCPARLGISNKIDMWKILCNLESFMHMLLSVLPIPWAVPSLIFIHCSFGPQTVTESPVDARNCGSWDGLSLQGIESLLEETEAKWKRMFSVDSPRCCRSTQERHLNQPARSRRLPGGGGTWDKEWMTKS